MSVINDASEPSDGERQPARNGFFDTFEQVRNYIRALPRPFGEKLSEHAAHAQHEDVPDDAVKAPKGLPPLIYSLLPENSFPQGTIRPISLCVPFHWIAPPL